MPWGRPSRAATQIIRNLGPRVKLDFLTLGASTPYDAGEGRKDAHTFSC